MLIKNNNNQVEILGTWQKETNKETLLTVKVNDVVIFNKNITSNEYINIVHELENDANNIEITETYNNIQLKKIKQTVYKINQQQEQQQEEQKKPIQAQENTEVYKSTLEVLNAPRFEKTGVYGEVNTVLGVLIVLLLVCLVSKGGK